tara:strand:+ start:856 stop:1353 length:498 start_codon:yes stop_codon:yes gene_type:complete
MIKELVSMATRLDDKGYQKEASYLDDIISKLANLEDEALSFDENLSEQSEQSDLQQILGGDTPTDIFDSRDMDYFTRGIEKSPDAMAQWFYNKIADSNMDLQSVMYFARMLGDIVSNNISDEEEGMSDLDPDDNLMDENLMMGDDLTLDGALSNSYDADEEDQLI